MDEMRIAHISDSHIAAGGEFRREEFSRIAEEINTSPFDLVVHTGDITDNGLREAYENSLSFIEMIEKPLITIPGNHDSRNVGYELFEEYYGNLNDVKVGKDYILLCVDSSIPDQNEGRVGSSKFNWLRERLMEYSSRKVKIVAVHHHLVPVPKSGTERNVLFNAGDLMDLLRKYGVNLVLSGHRHYPNVVNVDGMVISNAGCMSCRKVRAGDVCSYNEVVLSPEDITVTIKRSGAPQRYNYPSPREEVFVSEGKKLTRLVQIAGTFFSDGKVFEKEKFEHAVKTINALQPELVLHCGDIVDMGIPDHYALAYTYLKQVEAPIVFTPGPRDINYIGYELFSELTGELEQKVEPASFCVHGINSSQYDSDVGMVGRFEQRRLEKAIREQKEEISIVFFHHNVVPLPHIREKGLLEDAGDLLKLLCDLQVDVVLTGHSSHAHATQVDNTIISNASTVSGKYVRSVYGNSFNVIDIYEHLIIVSKVHSLLGSKRILGIWRRKGIEKPFRISDGSQE